VTNIDYRLLERFEASRRRFAAARLALPEHWRTDPRPEAQFMNEHWVTVIAEAAEHEDRRAKSLSSSPLAFEVDDR